jgi:molybdate transport system substrate-binding protein
MRRASSLLAVTATLTGCASSTGEDAGGGARRLVVAAAASMQEPLRACAGALTDARVRLSFAGSDALAAQVRQGAPLDVYVAANTELPEALAKDGLVERPVRFATNELVVAVPDGASELRALGDLARGDVAIATAAESVPAGSYARTAIGRLPAGEREAILANVRTAEPDVRGVIGKLLQGAVDAGLVYRSDVAAAGGRLRIVRLPARSRPPVMSAAAAVRGSGERRLARRYVRGLRRGPCRRALTRAGFGPPPR